MLSGTYPRRVVMAVSRAGYRLELVDDGSVLAWHCSCGGFAAPGIQGRCRHADGLPARIPHHDSGGLRADLTGPD